MNNFIELLKKDAEAEHEFADENLVSSLYCTSLSHPLREEPNSPDFKTSGSGEKYSRIFSFVKNLIHLILKRRISGFLEKMVTPEV